MDAASKALRLEPVRPVQELLALLDPSTRAALKTLLPVRPLLLLLTDLQGLIRHRIERTDTVDADVRGEALLDIGRLAVAKHAATRALFERLASALTAEPPVSDAWILTIQLQNARLAMEMLAFAAELLARSGLREKGGEAFMLAARIADTFDLPEHRGIALHQLGIYRMDQGDFAGAEHAMAEADELLKGRLPAEQRANDNTRATALQLKLLVESERPLPPDALILVAALAADEISRDELRKADALLARVRHLPQDVLDAHPQYLLAEARLARRRGSFDKAANLLDRAAQSPTAESFRRSILQQRFFLARDLRQFKTAAHLLDALRAQGVAPHRAAYHQAVLALLGGSETEARALFEACIRDTTDEAVRADCYGMLGAYLDDYEEGTRHLYAAIGIYLRLGKALDHAIVLLNLAKREWVIAMQRKRSGDPPITISNFSRADRLIEAAQRLAEPLDARNFVLDLLRQRARLEWDRGRPHAALRHFRVAVTQMELIYLSFTDREKAEQFHAENGEVYARAMACALDAARFAEALSFSERAKARRLVRDFAVGGGGLATAPEIDGTLLEVVRTLRFKLLEGRPLTTPERLELNDAEERLSHVLSAGGMQHFRVRGPDLYVAPADPPHEDEAIVEFPGGGVMRCEHCGVFNRIASTHCSACDARLPKSIVSNLFAMDEEAVKERDADSLYNDALRLFDTGDVEEASRLLRQAIETRTHPDYKFFLGLCLLALRDVPGGREAFGDVRSLQYASMYPFWPLPVPPSRFESITAALDEENQDIVFEQLMHAIGEFYAETPKR